MEQSLGPDQLQHILDTLKADHRQFMTIYRSSWRVDDRPNVHTRLAGSVTKAQRAAARLEDTTHPELRPLVDKLIIESILAEGILKNPSLVQR
jgi:hypothetical protein